MNEKETAFVADLIELLKKYHVTIVEHEDYDGHEQYCGSHFNFEGADIRLPIDEINDVY